MTVCNMSIEGGARAGMVAPDDKTYAYLKDRPKSPKGALWDQARRYWETLVSDDGAHFDEVVTLDAANLPPIVSWGTSPQDVAMIGGFVPRVEDGATEAKRASIKRALDYMGLKGGERIADIAIDRVFIGSCTNGRIEDLRAAAKVVAGHKVSERVNAMVVPGSGLVKAQAEAEGLDKIFAAAGGGAFHASLTSNSSRAPLRQVNHGELRVRPRNSQQTPSAVMAGLVPAIHAARLPLPLKRMLRMCGFSRRAAAAERRGWPGQARP